MNLSHTELRAIAKNEHAGGSFLTPRVTQKNKYNGGLKGTVGDTNVNIIGSVRFFMNVCASFINAINSPNQEDRTYDYEEHFGNHGDMKGSTSFPSFDFDCQAILNQVDGCNCGLVVLPVWPMLLLLSVISK